ncbi:hypothetical protein QTN25_004320 [Entamoeba marina]
MKRNNTVKKRIYQRLFESKIVIQMSHSPTQQIEVIPQNEIIFIKRIGNGSEGNVYKANYKGEIVFVKPFNES